MRAIVQGSAYNNLDGVVMSWHCSSDLVKVANQWWPVETSCEIDPDFD